MSLNGQTSIFVTDSCIVVSHWRVVHAHHSHGRGCCPFILPVRHGVREGIGRSLTRSQGIEGRTRRIGELAAAIPGNVALGGGVVEAYDLQIMLDSHIDPLRGDVTVGNNLIVKCDRVGTASRARIDANCIGAGIIDNHNVWLTIAIHICGERILAFAA